VPRRRWLSIQVELLSGRDLVLDRPPRPGDDRYDDLNGPPVGDLDPRRRFVDRGPRSFPHRSRN
jgi:hypothetical protein